MPGRIIAAILAFCLLLTTNGCQQCHVEATLVNRTGVELRLIEIDYPSASFGANALGPGETLRNPMRIHGSGSVRIQYVIGNSSPVSIQGPTLSKGQQGRLDIDLLPGGKAEFHPALTPAS
jgi:hypothetical protein